MRLVSSRSRRGALLGELRGLKVVATRQKHKSIFVFGLQHRYCIVIQLEIEDTRPGNISLCKAQNWLGPSVWIVTSRECGGSRNLISKAVGRLCWMGSIVAAVPSPLNITLGTPDRDL